MKTVPEILEDWETDQFNDWYAVDSYRHGKVTRLFVGERERAKKIAADRAAGVGLVNEEGELVEPGWNGTENVPFYRCVLIPSIEAKAYFDGLNDDLDDWLTQKKAAEMLGVTAGRVSQLASRGQLETCGKLVSRKDVMKRLKGVTPGRPKKSI